MSKSVGIFGGSFNPVHVGHVGLAEEVQRLCGFDPLWIVPSKNPPHKPPYEIPEEHRLEMVRLAFENVPGTKISTFEIDNSGPSYAIRTIEYFSRQHPGQPLYFILGTDAFQELPHWYAFPDVMEACSYVVVTRSGWDEQAEHPEQSKLALRLKKLEASGLLRKQDGEAMPFDAIYTTRTGTRICILRILVPEVSSTEVRIRTQLGENIKGLVPSSVERYLKTVGLYGTGTRNV